MKDIISWHSDNSFTRLAAEEYRVLENYEVANLYIVPTLVPSGINCVGELARDGREHRGTCVWLWMNRKLGQGSSLVWNRHTAYEIQLCAIKAQAEYIATKLNPSWNMKAMGFSGGRFGARPKSLRRGDIVKA